MNKLFYRRDFKTKTFFDNKVKIRSYAFGEKVNDSFCKCQDVSPDAIPSTYPAMEPLWVPDIIVRQK